VFGQFAIDRVIGRHRSRPFFSLDDFCHTVADSKQLGQIIDQMIKVRFGVIDKTDHLAAERGERLSGGLRAGDAHRGRVVQQDGSRHRILRVAARRPRGPLDRNQSRIVASDRIRARRGAQLMDTGLKGKTVLITGASRNMGRIAAIAFAREGANLAICTSTRIKELDAVAAQARALGVQVVAEKCDVTDGEAVKAFIAKTRAELGGIDVAINLAGNRHEVKFLEQTLDGWHKNIAVNLTGPFHICQQVIPLMIEKKYGRIINIAGVTPYIGGPPAKSMVKLGIVGLTRGLAREFAPHNITANCIGPGGVQRLDLDPDEHNKPLRPGQSRMGTAEEIVSLMVYLASDKAGYITGQCYLANGGRYFQ